MFATMLLAAALSLPGALREAPGADPYSSSGGVRSTPEARDVEPLAAQPRPRDPGLAKRRVVTVVRTRPVTTVVSAALARASSVASGMLRGACDDSSEPSASSCTSSCAPSSRCSRCSRSVES
jgi:hypothetical protein